MEEKTTPMGTDSYSADSLLESQVNNKYIPLLTNCFVALRSSSLYPPGHHQIALAMEQAHEGFVKELEKQAPLIFGVAQHIVIFNELPVGPGVQAVTEFAKALTEHGIVSLSFRKGVSPKSLISFFQLLSYPPEKAAGELGIQQELMNLGGSHIDIATIDYDLFQLSDKESWKTDGTGQNRHRENIWLTFTRRLLQGGFSAIYDHSQETDDDSNTSAVTWDPVQLANFINKNQLDAELNNNSYGVMLDELLTSNTTGDTADSPAKEAQTAPGVMSEEELAMVTTMLDGLNPAVRQQFLATTLDKCQKHMNSSATSKLLTQLPPKLVIEILDIVNSGDQSISPALLSLIQQLARRTSPSSAQDGASLPSPRGLEILMTRERHEDYVDSDYDHMLQILGRNQQPLTPPPGFVVEEEEKTLTDSYLITQLTHLLITLLDNTDSEEDYATYAEKLTEVALDLPSFGVFSLVDRVTEILSDHVRNQSSPLVRKVAEKCLSRIEGRDYVESIAALLSETSTTDKALAIHALISRGPLAMAELIDFYCEEKKSLYSEEVIRFFKKYRVECLAEIARRLPRGKPDKVLFLLALAKELDVGGAAPLLRPLLIHHNEDIRAATLDILLPLQDSEALQYLRDMLHSTSDSIVESALTMAWKYKTAPLLPELIALLDYRCLKTSRIRRNGRIILALSGIGDPSALPALEKLADSKCLLHPKQAKNMKEALFLSLASYPLDDIIPLCRKGMKSKQEAIRKRCQSLLSRAGRGG